jgi:hypothetical protein
MPDYITIDVSASLPWDPVFYTGGSLTITRQGHVFFGPQLGEDTPGFVAAVRGGWIDQSRRPTPGQVDSFIHGWSMVGSGFLPDVGETWGNPLQPGWRNFATEAGVGVGAGVEPSFGGDIDYSWRAPFSLPVGW